MSFNHKKYKEILDFIAEKSQKNVKVVAVSKNQALESIKEAISYNVNIFGENRVQEAKNKFGEIKAKNHNIELHLTGPLQTNKVKDALKLFDVFQTLDRKKLALEFLKYPELTFKKKFFIQINIGREKNKSGVLPEDSESFIKYCKNDMKLPICGLMCIPPINEPPEKYFSFLSSIAKEHSIDDLSMGMSADYKAGVLSGATTIRIGTLLFGERK